MDKNHIKEQFNIAYVNAMVAQAGLNHSILAVDNDSVDLLVTGTGFKGKYRNPQIHFQLKCTSGAKINNDNIKFQLKRKNYDDLRGNNVLCPRYLAVLLVPESKKEWIDYGDNNLTLNNTCYWLSIKDHPESQNKKSVTVDIPIHQRLTAEQLIILMTNASQEASV
jgi:hypothetical protein